MAAIYARRGPSVEPPEVAQREDGPENSGAELAFQAGFRRRWGPDAAKDAERRGARTASGSSRRPRLRLPRGAPDRQGPLCARSAWAALARRSSR